MPPVFINFGARRQSSFGEPLGLLSDCHRRIESFLADMRRVALELRGGTLSDADRAALAGAVHYFTVAAPRHTADEEESLFPRLRAASEPRAAQALDELSRLEADHQRADACHHEANALANRWLTSGTLDAPDTQRLIELLSTLTTIYTAHIAVEDSTVFPAAGQALGASELEAIGREMAARRGVDYDEVVARNSRTWPLR
jgi:hemerythrin-like domain-containing protein